MPIYCYVPKSGKKGKIVEQLHAFGKAPAEVTIDGIVYERSIAAEQSGRVRPGDLWPLLSDAAGVHPDQVQEAQKTWAAKGIPTEFTPDGQAVFRSPQHRKQFLKAAGLHDKAAYY